MYGSHVDMMDSQAASAAVTHLLVKRNALRKKIICHSHFCFVNGL